MKITNKYYKLKSSKDMNDGFSISCEEDLVFVKKDNEHMLFMVEINDEYVFFWTTYGEVDFLESKEEEWSDEKINIINKANIGEFL